MYAFKYDFNQVQEMTDEQLMFLLQGYINMKKQEQDQYKNAKK